jgi:paraquat-inducible protein B
MSDTGEPPHAPLTPPPTPPPAPPPTPIAVVQGRHWRHVSMIWLIPAVTLVVGIYLAITTLSARGPTIEITFDTAEGLKAGQSQIKHKDVVLGTIRSIRLTDDFNHVVVTAEMRAGVDRLLTTTSQLWVVKPRFFAGNLQGIDTLLSGSYIDLLPGDTPGEPTHTFTGLEEPPVITAPEIGTTFFVRADRLGSISIGSPVFYRDLSVGQVLGWDLGQMADYVTLRMFVRAPFNRYVTDKTRFWNASGISVSLSGSGVKVQVESLRALLLGGVAFDTPPAQDVKEVGSNTIFELYKDKEDADNASYERTLHLISYFDGSVRGLVVGSSVDLRGIRIGEVTDIRLAYDPVTDRVRVPVRYEVQPDRIANNQFSDKVPAADIVASLVRRGLRAKVASTSLITGGQAISLDIEADAPVAEMRVEKDARAGDTLVIPSLQSGGLETITTQASDLLRRLNALPLASIGKNLDDATKGAAELTNSHEVRSAMVSLQGALADLQEFIHTTQHDAQPAIARLPAIAAGLQEAVARASKLIGSADTGYGSDSRFKRDLDRLLAQLSDTAQSVRVLADLLTRHPEALIRGRTNTGVE